MPKKKKTSRRRSNPMSSYSKQNIALGQVLGAVAPKLMPGKPGNFGPKKGPGFAEGPKCRKYGESLMISAISTDAPCSLDTLVRVKRCMSLILQWNSEGGYRPGVNPCYS